MSYGELYRLTEELATRLRHLGVKTNILVGILLDRSLECGMRYIAILRAG
jgi:acyl-coenzyme A synthetase/AMP-(fatty) acid ligase